MFSAFSKWACDSLPENYRNSVFITLDNDDLSTQLQHAEKSPELPLKVNVITLCQTQIVHHWML